MLFKVVAKVLLSYLYNPLTLYRINEIGKKISIGKGLSVHNPSKISIGDNVHIGRMARLSCFGHGKIQIEEYCYICDFFTALSADTLTIKKNTLIASYVAIIAENHGMNPEAGVRYGNQPLIGKPIIIGENCWIGEKVMILAGVTIGDWVIIGAGSVVSKSIPSYSIAVGNPARVIKNWNFITHKWEACKNS